mmetsp:Transcript_18529/g.70299  ORF Transcript_18529/g.70299 Transcript_18529/m.70299 type:complete len:356 (+) Transcript_18529:215-1282(+)
MPPPVPLALSCPAILPDRLSDPPPTPLWGRDDASPPAPLLAVAPRPPAPPSVPARPLLAAAAARCAESASACSLRRSSAITARSSLAHAAASSLKSDTHAPTAVSRALASTVAWVSSARAASRRIRLSAAGSAVSPAADTAAAAPVAADVAVADPAAAAAAAAAAAPAPRPAVLDSDVAPADAAPGAAASAPDAPMNGASASSVVPSFSATSCADVSTSLATASSSKCLIRCPAPLLLALPKRFPTEASTTPNSLTRRCSPTAASASRRLRASVSSTSPSKWPVMSVAVRVCASRSVISRERARSSSCRARRSSPSSSSLRCRSCPFVRWSVSKRRWMSGISPNSSAWESCTACR